MEEKNSFGNNITLQLNNGVIIQYSENDHSITHNTRHGAFMKITVPSDWGLTRIFQFMESLAGVTNQLT